MPTVARDDEGAGGNGAEKGVGCGNQLRVTRAEISLLEALEHEEMGVFSRKGERCECQRSRRVEVEETKDDGVFTGARSWESTFPERIGMEKWENHEGEVEMRPVLKEGSEERLKKRRHPPQKVSKRESIQVKGVRA